MSSERSETIIEKPRKTGNIAESEVFVVSSGLVGIVATQAVGLTDVKTILADHFSFLSSLQPRGNNPMPPMEDEELQGSIMHEFLRRLKDDGVPENIDDILLSRRHFEELIITAFGKVIAQVLYRNRSWHQTVLNNLFLR